MRSRMRSRSASANAAAMVQEQFRQAVACDVAAEVEQVELDAPRLEALDDLGVIISRPAPSRYFSRGGAARSRPSRPPIPCRSLSRRRARSAPGDCAQRLHFHVRQFNTIEWTDAADLRSKLTMRISATIGDGPRYE
jgi:hypothetical protein